MKSNMNKCMKREDCVDIDKDTILKFSTEEIRKTVSQKKKPGGCVFIAEGSPRW